jgi:hypothetical protein
MSLLAALLSPGAQPTQRMLLTSWPDAGARMLRVALDGWECGAVRAAACRCAPAASSIRSVAAAAQLPSLVFCEGVYADVFAFLPGPALSWRQCPPRGCRFLVAAAAVSPTMLGVAAAAAAAAAEAGDVQGGSGGGALTLHRLGLAALLQQTQLWEDLPALLVNSDTPPALVAAAAALALVAAAADPGGAALQLLSVRGVMPSMLRLVRGAALAGGGPTAACDAHLRALQQLGCRWLPAAQQLPPSCPGLLQPQPQQQQVEGAHPAASLALQAPGSGQLLQQQRCLWAAASCSAASSALQVGSGGAGHASRMRARALDFCSPYSPEMGSMPIAALNFCSMASLHSLLDHANSAPTRRPAPLSLQVLALMEREPHELLDICPEAADVMQQLPAALAACLRQAASALPVWGPAAGNGRCGGGRVTKGLQAHDASVQHTAPPVELQIT